ncbi:MAG: TolC family protein, partial [Lysobacterales bacterium]
MQFDTKHKGLLIAAAFVVASPAFAVDLIGVYELAIKNDPQLQAAAYRKDATGENKRQAWANLLPTLSGSASMVQGDSETNISLPNAAGMDFPDIEPIKSDIDTESWRFDLRQ